MQNQHRHWMCWTSTANDSVSRKKQRLNSWWNFSGWPIQSIITYENRRRCTYLVYCMWFGEFIHGAPCLAVWYDRQWHIGSTVDTYLWTLRPVIIYLYPSQPFWLDRLLQYQYTVYVLRHLSQDSLSRWFRLCICLDEHFFWFAYVEDFLARHDHHVGRCGWPSAPHRLNNGNGGARASSEYKVPSVRSWYSFSLLIGLIRDAFVRYESNTMIPVCELRYLML